MQTQHKYKLDKTHICFCVLFNLARVFEKFLHIWYSSLTEEHELEAGIDAPDVGAGADLDAKHHVRAPQRVLLRT